MEKHQRELQGYDVLAKDGNEQSDQFSRLCNTIIHHILSFLPVRDAAKTSILSKRWRRLFASMPILDFDRNCFLEKDGGALRSHPDDALVDFMRAAIVCREKVPINFLRITLNKYTSSFYYPVRQWIQMAMKSNVHEMDLDFSGGDYFLQRRDYAYDPLQAYCCDDDIRHLWDYYPPNDLTNDEGYLSDELDLASENSSSSNSDDESESSYFIMPRALFNCGSLRVLKLAECDITNAGPMSFGNLISLVLIDVEISEKILHKMLSSCCCKLEGLTLSRIPQLKRLAFSAPKLLSLKLECCHSLKKVTIDAKELRHFKLGLNYTREVLSLNFPSVVKAEIGFCDNINYSNMGQRADRLVKLLKDISHVKDLILYSRFLKDMDIPESQLKSFTMSTVRRLEVIGKMGSDTISTIFSLLKAFGNLESLSLSIVQPYNSEGIAIDHEEKQIRKLKNTSTSCFESNLKELKIQGFQGSNIENMILKFLLDNCKVLEKVDIRTYTPSFWTHGELNAQLLSYCNLKDLKLNYN